MSEEEKIESEEGLPSGDVFDLSDEEFEKLGDSFMDETFEDSSEKEELTEESEASAEDSNENSDFEEESEEASSNDVDEETDTKDESDSDKESDEESEGDDTDSTDDDDTADSESDGDDESEKDDPVKDASSNHEDFFKKVTTPFRANGKEMHIDNPDDVVRLMQMGANYNRKMAALKPNLKILKMLEKNELLDEGKLGFLIDIDKKNPEAITKLLKDSKIDPVDIDLEGPEDYSSPDYKVSDKEIDLDTVLDDLKDSDTYTKTLDAVASWDDESKQIVADMPQLVKVIDDHMASGIYNRISTAVQKERMFGRLTGVSELEAYKTVGDRLHAEGAFDDLSSDTSQEKPSVNKPATKKSADVKKRQAKRKAARSTKPAAPSSKVSEDYNPLAMSDEDFEKQLDSKFL